MATMYIANCTRQVQDFQYRLPERNRAFKQTIDVGRQIKLPGDLSTPDVEAVVRQHARYGMRSLEEAKRQRDFIGLVYSLDKAVTAEMIRIILAGNRDVLVTVGEETRQAAGVAAHNFVAEQLQREFGSETDLDNLEVQIEEKPAPGTDQTINERMSVSRNAQTGGKGAVRTGDRPAKPKPGPKPKGGKRG